MIHRRDIDGLRAIAVVPVVLFHAGFPLFPGGFVGVDVFFVISGFLITGLLLDDLSAGRFSILHFYERRARRILPALFVVVAVTALLSFFVMLPDQLRGLGESVAAVAVFLSNFYFLSQVGYFAPDAELQPLLHTWSLAVEEQFYLIFPPLLVLLYGPRRRGRVLFWLSAAAAASLLLAVLAGQTSPARSFFFTGGRVWELLAGSLAATFLQGRARPENGAMAMTGLAMILAACLFFDAATPTPGLFTLVPVAGTVALLLFSGSTTGVGRLLARPAFVGVGLISYSAYLWHQPLFALARLAHVAEPPPQVMLGLVASTLLLAWGTWAFVEQPFRRRQAPWLQDRARLLMASALLACALIAGGVAMRQTDGLAALWQTAFPDRAAIARVIDRARTETLPQDDGACRFNVETIDAATALRLERCARLHGPGIGVLGDSHAIDLFGIVTARGDRPFVAGFTKPSCRPGTSDRECPYQSLESFLRNHPNSFKVMLFEMSGAYLLLDKNRRPGVQTEIERMPLDRRIPDFDLAHEEIARVSRYLEALGKSVPLVWIGPRIEPQVQLAWLVGRGCDAGLILRANTEANHDRLDAALARVGMQSGIAYLSQNEALDLRFPDDFGSCDGLYWSDGDHFSALGESVLGRRADIAGIALQRLLAR